MMMLRQLAPLHPKVQPEYLSDYDLLSVVKDKLKVVPIEGLIKSKQGEKNLNPSSYRKIDRVFNLPVAAQQRGWGVIRLAKAARRLPSSFDVITAQSLRYLERVTVVY